MWLLLRHVRVAAARVGLIVIPGCLFVCLSAPADEQQQCCCGAAAACCVAAVKVKAGQWVTPNPTRPTIRDRIC